MQAKSQMHPFSGDGRRVMAPLFDAPNGTRPIPVTRSNARRLVRRLLDDGKTYHSILGSTVWVLFAWARVQNRKVVMQAQKLDGKVIGWEVELIKEPS